MQTWTKNEHSSSGLLIGEQVNIGGAARTIYRFDGLDRQCKVDCAVEQRICFRRAVPPRRI
jgi:hypothetical protein